MHHVEHLELSFVVLAAPLPAKVLQAFRKDAGWTQTGTPKRPLGKVQWVTVNVGARRIGVARLELAPPEFCYVADLIVDSKFRGNGVGSWFLKRIEQYCLSQGILRLVLEPESGSRHFYESHHFVDDPYVPRCMKKDISPLQRKVWFS